MGGGVALLASLTMAAAVARAVRRFPRIVLISILLASHPVSGNHAEQGHSRQLPFTGAPKDLIHRPIKHLASLLRSKRVSCVNLVRAFLDRLREMDRFLSVAMHIFDRVAIDMAHDLDDQLSRGLDRGPLMCIPFGVKDHHQVYDEPTTYGHVLYGAHHTDLYTAGGYDAPVRNFEEGIRTAKTVLVDFYESQPNCSSITDADEEVPMMSREQLQELMHSVLFDLLASIMALLDVKHRQARRVCSTWHAECSARSIRAILVLRSRSRPCWSAPSFAVERMEEREWIVALDPGTLETRLTFGDFQSGALHGMAVVGKELYVGHEPDCSIRVFSFTGEPLRQITGAFRVPHVLRYFMRRLYLLEYNDEFPHLDENGEVDESEEVTAERYLAGTRVFVLTPEGDQLQVYDLRPQLQRPGEFVFAMNVFGGQLLIATSSRSLDNVNSTVDSMFALSGV
ncbi:hypothetical protein EMIHUDRAFT_109495 [Emiliania huxleyi CCMP1516]|uniref:Amidase domain-containing protein n=2 Tax=Emiliania huxleyi TaxID=2903 RepID=A0A0D3KQ54_EMIH1|nr:hypothetical protein EMIHUDRAFT_109495 [Emiliania huxleyi CCMP1516]EOD37889.1 hypothetical protein EMIHUDRAFT_109495 [Emiliania huxleyi CCMP1516]|eukprot:XP_005790318.1 hypothetical protein EMIHUDRAFT_109495 [Emiliania huxleyi CCMP1516]